METVADPEQLLITIGLYDRMCVAAAKLAVAAGASPADARHASGLQRVEIRQARGPVMRQTEELDKVAILVGDEIPRRLIAPERVLTAHGQTMAADYLQLSRYARDQKSLCLYRKAVNDLNQEFNRITAQFFTLGQEFKSLSNEYDVQGKKIDNVIASAFGHPRTASQLIGDRVRRFSWLKREKLSEQIYSIVRERDYLRMKLSIIADQLNTTMAAYQRHQARRAYLRSISFREFGDHKSLFVPRATLYTMKKFDFGDALVKDPEQIVKILQLANQWNQIRIAFADERKSMKLRHQRDGANDHTLYGLIHLNYK